MNLAVKPLMLIASSFSLLTSFSPLGLEYNTSITSWSTQQLWFRVPLTPGQVSDLQLHLHTNSGPLPQVPRLAPKDKIKDNIRFTGKNYTYALELD